MRKHNQMVPEDKEKIVKSLLGKRKADALDLVPYVKSL